MVSEVVMPKMGYDMTEGTIVRWVKQEGDEVKHGEVIAEMRKPHGSVRLSRLGNDLPNDKERAGSADKVIFAG